MTSSARQKVVVVGAGFGGMSVVRSLARVPADVIVIDRNNHHLFQPLLYQVATAALDPSNIGAPIRALLARQSNVEVMLGEVDGIDVNRHTVMIAGVGEIRYDQLVIATGSVSSWFGHDDWAASSIGLKSLRDAETVRLRLLGAFEWAETRAHDKDDVRRLLTFVIVGGGATGVELAGSIRILARDTLRRDFRRIDTNTARVLLIEGSPAILGGFPERLGRYARRQLESMGVDVRTGVHVSEVDEDGVVAGGERIRCANVFWCAGVAATPAAAWTGAPSSKNGAIRVEPDFSVPGHPEIYAIGDVASLAGADGKLLPGVAPVAKQAGRYVAKVIAARISGSPAPRPFRYVDQGSLAIIGRSAAVADLPFARLTGRPAWLLWAGVHLVLLNGLGNRALVTMQWLSAWLFRTRGSRLMDTGIAGLRDAARKTRHRSADQDFTTH